MIAIFLILLCISSCFFVWLYRTYAIKKNILDHPNYRSSHLYPVPRGGGVVFPILWFVVLVFLYFNDFIGKLFLFAFIPPIGLISFISFLDDKYQIAVRYRFLAHIVAALYILFVIGSFSSLDLGIIVIHWYWFGYIFTMLALLWSTNLFNFMDGIDGIAAIEALFVFGVGGYFVWCAGGNDLALMIWAMAAIVLGFLLWNKPPAKIFMGDVGSTVLGFLVALFAIMGEKKYNVPALLWVMLYGVFWFDATVTLIRRLINGDKVYEAHLLHAFHRLSSQNWSHREILLGVIAINIVIVLLSLLAFYFPRYMLTAFSGEVVMLIVIYLLIEKVRPMYLR